jgi:hypothetical protein
MRFRLFQLEGAEGREPEPSVMPTASRFDARARFCLRAVLRFGGAVRHHRFRQSWRRLIAAPPVVDRSGAKWTVQWLIPRGDQDTATTVASVDAGSVSAQRCAGR